MISFPLFFASVYLTSFANLISYDFAIQASIATVTK